jgi:hypothetical protein
MSFEFYFFENDESRTDLLDIHDEYEECNFDESSTVVECEKEK